MPIAIRSIRNSPDVLDTKTGEIVPSPANLRRSIHRAQNGPFSNVASHDARVEHIPGVGTKFRFDPDSGLVIYPRYGTGSDDVLNRAIVRGHMANGGLTPLPMPLISTIVSKMQQTAATWVINFRGRRAPVKRAVEIVALADNSTDGAATFIQNLVGAIYTDNRGAICSILPIGEIEFERWGEYGMSAVKLTNDPNDLRYVLEADLSRLKDSIGLWTIDGLDCSPTGYSEYQFWLQKPIKVKDSTRMAWVLIPRQIGFQILQPAGPKHNLYSGYGQSGTWRAAPLVAEGLAVGRMQLEALSDTPPNGIVHVSGLDWPGQFREEYDGFLTEQRAKGNMYYKEPFLFGTRSRDAKMEFVAWTQPPPGYTRQQWFDELTTTLAAAYHLNEAHIRLRYGDGVSQAQIADALESETAVAFLRTTIESALNRVVPPRVQVRVIWKSDRSVVRQLEAFSLVSLAISRLQKRAGEIKEDDPTFSNEEIRAIIETTIGLEIPEVSSDTESVSSPSTPEDFRLSDRAMQQLPLFMSCDVPREVLERPGTVVACGDGKVRVLDSVQGSYAWVFERGGLSRRLVSASSLRVLGIVGGDSSTLSRRRGRAYSSPAAEGYRVTPGPGDRAITDDGTPVSVVSMDGVKAMIRYDWDKGDVGPRPYPAQLLSRFQFVPDGEPLPYPESYSVEDRAAALRDAVAFWKATMGEDGDIIDGAWDSDAKVWIVDGVPATGTEMASYRDKFRQAASDSESDASDDGSLVSLLLLGLLALGAWETRARASIARSYIAMYVFARGGASRLQDDDWGIIEAEILLQHQFLNLFMQELTRGLLSEAQIASRFGLYYQSMSTIYEDAAAAAHDYRLILPAVPGDYSSECGSYDKCFWAYTEGPETIVCQWVRTDSESCPTCIRREECPPLVFIKATGEHLSSECY